MLEVEYSEMYANSGNYDNFEIKYTLKPTNRFEFAYLHAGEGENICDIGMGGGEVLYSLKNKFQTFYGIELSKHRLNVANSRCKDLNTHFFNVPFDEPIDLKQINNIDTAVCLDVLDHMIDVRQALKNMYNILSEDGRLILTVPNIARINRRVQLLFGKFPSTSTAKQGLEKLGNSSLLDGGKLHYFTFSSLKSLVYEAGFAKIEAYGIGKHQKLYNLYPSLLSGSIALVCFKRDN